MSKHGVAYDLIEVVSGEFAPVPDAIAIIDLNDYLTECNPEALNVLGHASNEVIGRSFLEFVTKKDREKCKKALEQGPTGNVEYTCSTQDGREFPAELVAIMKAFTERQGAEEKYRTLVEQSLEGIMVIQGVPPRVVFANPTVIRISGYTQEELASLSLELLIHPADRDTFFSRLKERFDGKPSTSPIEYRVIRKDGKVFWVELFSNLILNNGKPAVQMTFIDITERKKMEAELRSQSDKVQMYLDFAGVMLVALDSEGLVQLVNRYGCDLLERSEKDILGKNWFDVFLPISIRENAKTFFNKIMAGKSDFNRTFFSKDFFVEYFEGPLLTLKGEERLCAYHTTPIRDVTGQIVGTFSSITDITERKQMEDDLKQSERRYRALFEESPIALMEEDFSEVKRCLDHLRESGVKDFDEYFRNHKEEIMHCLSSVRILDMNEAAMKMRGFKTKKENLASLDKYLVGEVSQEMYDGFRAEFVAIAEGKTTFEKVGPVAPILGREKIHNTKWVAIPGHEQTLSKVIVSIVDITERMKMENELRKHTEHLKELVDEKTAELRQSEERYRRFFENSPVSLWEEDFSEVKRYLDELKASGIGDLRAYLGNHPEAVAQCASMVKVIDVNEGSLSLFGVEGKKDLLTDISRFYVDESFDSFREELIAIGEGNTVFETETAYRSMGGDKLHIILKWVAIPGLEKTLARVLVSLADITERKRLEEKLRQAERLAAIGETTSQVGHDLRNPLQVVVNKIYLMDKKVKSSHLPYTKKRELETMIESMGRQMKYMDKIVSDLQDYAAPLRPKFIKTPLNHLIEEIVSDMEVLDNVEIVINVPEDLEPEIDQVMMRRVLTNMFTNAVQAMPNGGQLTVGASKSDEVTSLTIKDTGVGIPEENIKRMFQPFFTAKPKGIGLGLPVCKRLIEAQGGVITVESQVGVGTAFTIRIPAERPVMSSTP